MAAALAQLHGAASVKVYEANPARVERTRALGFDAGQPNESKADTTDVMFECAGAARAVAYSIKIAR
jgi:threonine dehydrogenase-like Zn-dependent dehydrogenase